MKKTMRFLSVSALALAGAVMIGCTKEEGVIDETPQQPVSKTVTLTTTVSLGEGTTRALNADGEKSFAEGEQIAVIYKDNNGDTQKAISDPLPIGTSGQTATFTVTFDDPDKLETVTYIYPATMAKADGTPNLDALASQDGTLATLASDLDYCSNSGEWDGDALPSLTLENQLAICAFTIKKEEGNTDITGSITSLTVKEGGNTYTITRTAAAGPIYVAMKPVNGGDIEFVTAEGTDVYTRLVNNRTLQAGHLYPLGVKVKFNARLTPLTFEAKAANSTVTFTHGAGNMEYSLDGTNWTDCQSGTSITLASIGDKVVFRGDNTSLGASKSFSGLGQCYLYGNVMSLLFAETFPTETALPANSTSTFESLFMNNATIYSHSYKTLSLPAETLVQSCYANMFMNCSNLTKAPDLPAETPALYCYNNMFVNCTSLNSVKCYLDPSGSYLYTTNWLWNVSSSGTFIKKTGTTWYNVAGGQYGIPSGWTVIEE